MELTKEQIQFIENRLENDGVKYWDIRIEMLDHVVTDAENRINDGETFKKAVQNSFVSLGWKENFNGSNFENNILEKQKVFAKEYRKRFWKYFKSNTIKTTSIVWNLSFLLMFYFISPYKVLLKYTLFTFLGLIVFFLFYFLTKYKVYKSIQLNNALTHATSSLAIINAFIYIPKMFEVDLFKFPFLIALIFGFAFIQSFWRVQFFIKEYQKVNSVYKQLIS